MLDVIVTHYREPDEIVNRFLNSLSKQTFHDLKVTIVDDGLDCPKLSCIENSFPFEVQQLKKIHKTVSAARNYGIDNTRAKYFMMCDCDDMFDSMNSVGLESAMDKIIQKDLSIYRSFINVEVWEQNKDGNLSALYKKDDTDKIVQVESNSINPSTVHGKIYSRKFINRFGIRFLDDLDMNEDGAFNCYAYDLCTFKGYNIYDDLSRFYIWKYNGESSTRTNKIYPVKGLDQFIKATSHIYRSMSKHGLKTSHYKIGIILFQVYYWLYLFGDRFIGKPEYEECKARDLSELKNFLEEFMPEIDRSIFKEEYLQKQMKKYLDRLEGCDLKSKLGVEDWLESL